MRQRLTLDKAPKGPTFREFFYGRFPHIPRGQWGIPGEPQTEVIDRFMTIAADYLDSK